MSITVSAVKARQNLGELLNIVSLRHEDVIIERAGKKIARLTSVEPEFGAVHEPDTASYATRKEKAGAIDYSDIFGMMDDAEHREFTEAVESLRVIDPEMWE